MECYLCLRTTIQIIQELNGLFLIPKYLLHKIGTRFLYYFCLCKSFKELFLQCLNPCFWAKADAKVRLFSIPSKFFGNFFQSLTKVFGIIDKTTNLYLINIYKITQKSLQFHCYQVHHRYTNTGYILRAYRRWRSR